MMTAGKQLKQKNGPRCLFTGTLSSSQTMQVVLWSILREKKVDSGVLLIRDGNNGVLGEIAVSWGLHVTGAIITNQPLVGYDALKILLKATNCVYEYLDYGSNTPERLENGMKLRLTDLISTCPNLPENMPTGKISLNRMRAMTLNESGEYSEDAIIDQSVLEKLRKFERSSMRLRVFAFWGAFVVFSSIAGLMGMCR